METENRLVVAKGEQVEEGWSGRLGWADISFQCVEWINNKVLLYGRESCIQFPMINRNGQEYVCM